MTPIRRRLLYIFRGTLLRLRITWAGQSLTLSVGYHVDRSKWDGQRATRNSTHDNVPAATINKVLQNLEQRIDDAFLTFETADTTPTPDQLRTAITPDDSPVSLSQAFRKFLSYGETERMWADNTLKTVRNLGSLLKAFRPRLTLEEIDDSFMREFATWQQTHRVSTNSFKTGQKGYSNTVIRKNCTMLRWFLRWAADKGLVSRAPQRDLAIHVKTIDRPVVFLTWDELTRLEQHPFPEGSEKDRARDFFTFCAFSSLRFSDAHALLKTSVGDKGISIVTAKTSTRIIIDLNSHTRRILDKYSGTKSPHALPRITLNRLNHLLKEIGRELGFDSPVTVSQYYGTRKVSRTVPKHELLASHCGRRTFIVNALSMGIPPNVVMKWTGHSEYSAMKPYIDIADSIRASEMSKFDR